MDETDPTFLGFSYDQMASFGTAMSIGGFLTQAVGAYYAAESQRYTLKSQAMDLKYRASMASLNARAAEEDAVLAISAGQQQAGRVGLQYRQVKSSMQASAAARGLQLGVGSQAEGAASVEYAKEVDMIAINANAVRAANAARARAVGMRNEARMSAASARGLEMQRGAISPGMSAGASLLAGAGTVARDWATMERQSARYRNSGVYY